MACDEFLQQVKHHFRYLFEDYDFEVIHREKASRPDYCLIILQSADCRIKFYRTWEEANVLFGTLAAPLTWQNESSRHLQETVLKTQRLTQVGNLPLLPSSASEHTLGCRQWFYIRGVLRFITHNKPDIEQLLDKVVSRTIEEQIQELSNQLQPW